MRGTVSALGRRSTVSRTRAYMPGFSRKPGFGTSISIGAVRVAGSNTGATRLTSPVNVSPGNASTCDLGDDARLHALEILLDEVGDQPHRADVHDRQDHGVGAGEGARIEQCAGSTKPSTGETTVVFDSVIFSSSMRDCVAPTCAFATASCDTAAL